MSDAWAATESVPEVHLEDHMWSIGALSVLIVDVSVELLYSFSIG